MSGEYISREAALKAIYTSTAPALEVKAMPAADVVEVRHGRWIVSATNLHFDSKCSACGETFYSPLRGSYIVHYAKYCPSCGAKMDGGKDE